MKEQLLLMLRSAIADKEWAIACASMETAHRDGWSCDWYQMIREAQAEIDRFLDLLKETVTEGT